MIFTLILLIGLFSSGMVFANETVTVGGVNFNIPDGFHKIDNGTSQSASFQDNQGNEIIISVNMPSDDSKVQGNPTTINNKEGNLFTAVSEDGESISSFKYQQDNKNIVITAKSPFSPSSKDDVMILIYKVLS